MIHDLTTLLDQQFAYLLSRDGAAFFLQLRRCLQVLESEPRMAALLEDLRQETVQLDRARKDHDEEVVKMLLTLKQRFLLVAPEADDSNQEAPSHDDLPALHEWYRTLAAFDAVAGGRRGTLRKESNRAGELLRILADKIGALQASPGAQKNQRPDLNDIAIERYNLEAQHDYWMRNSEDELNTSPGIALVALESILHDLNPEPSPVRSNDEIVRGAFQEVLSGKHRFREAVYGKEKTDGMAKPLAKAKLFAEQVREGLRLKIGSRRSLRGLLARYKARCQTHDRKRMQQLGLNPKTTEPVLTAELALWLFDQGYNPLTEVPIAGIRPDILDASRDPSASLYVEAKQYKSGEPVARRVQHAMYQVYTSVARLRSDHIDVSEAFLVIFRRSGPALQAPAEVRTENLTVFIEVIDIAPAEETGSRERLRPVQLSAEDLLPATVERVTK